MGVYDAVYFSGMFALTSFLALLIIKHLIVDFYLQNEYMCKNKGTYGHIGGVLHSGLHGLGTGLVVTAGYTYYLFYPFLDHMTLIIVLQLVRTILTAMLFDYIIHYHMDWFKMWWCKRNNYTPETPKFWIWLGIDQFVHTITYLIIAFYVAWYIPTILGMF